jgi:preprotein translocase subunit SecD
MDAVADKVLEKVATMDFIVALAISSFLVGGIWISLKSDVSQAQEVSSENAAKLNIMSQDLIDVKTSVAVIQVQAEESEKRNAERATAAEKRDDAQSQELRDIKQILLQGAK